MKDNTLGRVRTRIGAIAALGLMMTAGLASASSASIDCEGYSACEDYGYGDHPYAEYWDMYSGHNCTNYVAYRLTLLGITARPWGGNGHGYMWDEGATGIYAVDKNPAPGAIAQFEKNEGYGDLGHVAYVESYDAANNTITISEDGASGGFRWETIPVTPNIDFIHIADQFTSIPTVEVLGSGLVDSVLTANYVGGWVPAPDADVVKWYRSGVADSIGSGATYTPTQDDVGHQITAKLIGSKSGYQTATPTSAPVTITAGQIQGMAVAYATGVPHLGEVLQASLGTDASGIALKYQWNRDGDVIEGATDRDHTVVPDDLGKRLSVTITMTKPGHQDKPVTSASTAVVDEGLVLMETPTISGTPAVDNVLYANVNVYPANASLSYQWTRNSVAIPGAVNSYYGVTASDVGASIRVVVTGSKATYEPATKTSGHAVPGLASIAISGPSISGTARVGYTLNSNVSVSTAGVSVAYAWYRNGTTLVGTGPTYTSTIYDNGAVISLNVTASKAGYATVYRNTGGVSIAPALMGTFYATIQGTNRVEYTLSAAVTSATPGVALTHYWKRNGSVVHTGTSYTLQPADIGQSITLTVVGTKAGYATSTTVVGAGATAGYLNYSFSGLPASVSGTPKVGKVLTAGTALQTSGVTITYRWYRNGSPISATGRTYTLTSLDKGKKMSVRVYFDKLGYQAISQLSSSTGTVVA